MKIALIELIEARRIALGRFHQQTVVVVQAHVSLE